MSECLFCKIANREIPLELLYEDDFVVAFKDVNPQAPIHFLVVPKQHIPNLLELSISGELLQAVNGAIRELATETGIYQTGLRLVINAVEHGGQTVLHLHFHVLGGRLLDWPPG